MKTRLLLTLLSVTPLLATPTLEQGEQRWTLRNEHVVVVFDRQNGGLPTNVNTPDGKPWLAGGGVYTDHGLFPEREYVGTDGVTDAKLTSSTAAGRTTVSVAGQTRRRGGEPSGLGYQLTVTLGDAPEFELSGQVTFAVSLDQATGFLAAVFKLPQVIEWAADTVDGRVNEVFAQDGRCYQSAAMPLNPEHPRLQVVYADGRLLTVDQPLALSGPLSNVFLHRYGDSAALFFAWLDSGASAPWPAGEAWAWSVKLGFGRLGE